MIVVDRLKAIGYDVEVKENNIRLSYKGEGAPDKNRVLPLLEELKAKKNEAVKELQKGEELEPISDETLQDIYLEVMNEINDSYISGTIKFVEENYPDLDRQIDEVDVRINEVWQLCIEGKSNLEDFRNELDSYKNLYLEGIELFREHLTTKASS